MLPLFLSLLFLSPIFSRECSSESLVPALYVFGDSLLDAGNNNLYSLVAKANYRPYGINFPTGITGRFTNGKTFADIIGTYVSYDRSNIFYVILPLFKIRLYSPEFKLFAKRNYIFLLN